MGWEGHTATVEHEGEGVPAMAEEEGHAGVAADSHRQSIHEVNLTMSIVN